MNVVNIGETEHVRRQDNGRTCVQTSEGTFYSARETGRGQNLEKNGESGMHPTHS